MNGEGDIDPNDIQSASIDLPDFNRQITEPQELLFLYEGSLDDMRISTRATIKWQTQKGETMTLFVNATYQAFIYFAMKNGFTSDPKNALRYTKNP